MSVVAGLLSRTGHDLPPALRATLVGSLSRTRGDPLECFEGRGWLLAKTDIGAYESRAAAQSPGGSALVLAGEPLLVEGEEALEDSRTGEAQRLLASLDAGDERLLARAMGVWCGAHYCPRTGTLTLVTDRLGVRPMYFAVLPGLVAFSSAMRVLEAIGACVGELDLRGTWETAAFGFPLADRSCYAAIRMLHPAEIVRARGEALRRSRYFRWDELADPGLDETQLLGELSRTFRAAVRNRLRGDRRTLAFLSGGMDSRTIAAELRAQGVTVHTVNFAPPGTQDRVFAALAAEALGTVHQQLEVPVDARMMSSRHEHICAWLASPGAPQPMPDRPRCLWSGDGGSVGLGHVYLDDTAIEAFERGDTEAGIRAFLDYNHIVGPAKSALQPPLRAATAGWHVEGVRDEIASLHRPPDGRALHLFLMFNDQRRHLTEHFENVDLRRLEFHAPFFDGRFLEVILRAKVHPFLRHALYNRWLAVLSPKAAAVPWQAYPGHLPGPARFDGHLPDQWGSFWGRRADRRLAREKGARAARVLLGRPFPGHLVRRANFAAAIALSLLGVTSYEHVIEAGEVFSRHWQRSHPAHPPPGG